MGIFDILKNNNSKKLSKENINKEEIIKKLYDKLKELNSYDKYIIDQEIIDEMNNSSNPFDFVEPILDIIGSNPQIDFGMPGQLVHFVEQFSNKGYEELLIKSVEKNPTSHNIWMLHRCFNNPNDTRHDIYVNIIKNLKESDKITEEIKNQIDDYNWK